MRLVPTRNSVKTHNKTGKKISQIEKLEYFYTSQRSKEKPLAKMGYKKVFLYSWCR